MVSFQTAAEHELIEERPVTDGTEAVRQSKVRGAELGGRCTRSGAPPLAYLTRWRMWRASRLLAQARDDAMAASRQKSEFLPR